MTLYNNKVESCIFCKTCRLYHKVSIRDISNWAQALKLGSEIVSSIIFVDQRSTKIIKETTLIYKNNGGDNFKFRAVNCLLYYFCIHHIMTRGNPGKGVRHMLNDMHYMQQLVARAFKQLSRAVLVDLY